MGEIPVAKDFLQAYLPAALLQEIDFSSLKVENQSFLDENYKVNAADIVYSVKLGGQIAYIYILCEQQTNVDKHMAFRLLTYTVRLMEEHLRKHPDSPLPFVYPMVVYSGEKPWDAPQEIFPLFGENESLARTWLLKPYQLIDIARMSDEEFQKHTWCGVMEFALKCRRVRNFAATLQILLPWIRALENEHPRGLVLGKVVLQYIVDGMQADETTLFLQEVDHYLSAELKGEAMTLAQCFEQQGLEKGLQQGRQQGRQEGKQEGEAAIIMRQIQRRFGSIPTIYAQKITQADSETLLYWSDKIFEASTLEEIFQ